MPEVSVVVPVHNRRPLLRALLAALRCQDHPDFEVVVVDDASTDDVGAEITAAEAAGLAVRLVRLDAPSGAVRARVAGVEASCGRVLAFTDSDCVPAPGWLTAGVGAVDAGAELVQGLTRAARPVRPLERSVWGEREDGLYATCNLFVRRDAYDRAGGFALDGPARLGFRHGRRARGLGFGEDALLGWRVRRSGAVRFEPGAVVEHHVFPADLRASLSRAWQAGAFPSLVREIPELREVLLVRRVLLGRRGQLWLLAACALLAARRPRCALPALAMWARPHVRRFEGLTAREAPAVAGELAVDAVTELALVAGSVRARRLVL